MVEINHAHGLVLQGGGALGSFELGVARAVYAEGCSFRPGVISGVSIGAISAVLLARPRNGDPLATLEAFWRRVTVSPLYPKLIQPAASMFGIPAFYTIDPLGALGTAYYSTAPLRRTLEELVDTDRLATIGATPHVVLTATDIEAGEIETFRSDRIALTLDHVLASGSLPPGFPATTIGGRTFWDGGVFDNTPLGPVLDLLDPQAADRAVMVVNLFPNRMPLPANMLEVNQTFLNLLFVNKTKGDVALMERFNLVARAIAELKTVPTEALAGLEAVGELLAKSYREVPTIMTVARSDPAQSMEGSDFSATGIECRAQEGLDKARAALGGKFLG